jgi:hypothetical protein
MSREREDLPRKLEGVARQRNAEPAGEDRTHGELSMGSAPLGPQLLRPPRAAPPASRTVAGTPAPTAVDEPTPILGREKPRRNEKRLQGSLVEPVDASIERSESLLAAHPTSIAHTEVDAVAPVTVRSRPMSSEESEAAGQGSTQRAALNHTPPSSAADPEVIHKTLQGRRSAAPVDVSTERAPPQPVGMGADRMITAPFRKRRNRGAERSTESTTVHVTIGTLEVRAQTLPAPPRVKPPTAKGPRLSLDEYLRQRRDGGRG